MHEVTVLFAPAFTMMTYGWFFKLQMLDLLNESFPCNSFREVKENADAYVYIYPFDSIEPFGDRAAYSTLGRYYGGGNEDGRIALNSRLWSFGDKFQAYRNRVIVHEFQHFFGLPNHYTLTKTTEEDYKERYCE